MNKVWIISELYYPTLNSTGYYMTEIAEHLAKKGLPVGVITTNLTYNEKSNPSKIKTESKNNVSIYRALLKQIDKNNFYSRTIRLLSSSFKLFCKSLFLIKKGDNVLVVTNPAFLILLMPTIKLMKGITYDILVHDIFPENLAAIGAVNSKSVIYKFLKYLFDNSYSAANKCIVIGRDMEVVIKKKTKYKTKTTLITNWAENDTLFPRKKEETSIITTLKLENKFIFQFAGNLGHAQGLDNILDAIELVTNPNIHFLFIGSGAMENEIKQRERTVNLKNITLLGFQDRKNQNDFLNACDVGIVTLSEGMFGLGVPSKSYNIMAVNKPILIVADERSEISLCVKEHNIGWTVLPREPEKLALMFEEIYTKSICDSGFGLNNVRSIADTFFAKNVILDKYLELYK